MAITCDPDAVEQGGSGPGPFIADAWVPLAFRDQRVMFAFGSGPGSPPVAAMASLWRKLLPALAVVGHRLGVGEPTVGKPYEGAIVGGLEGDFDGG